MVTGNPGASARQTVLNNSLQKIHTSTRWYVLLGRQITDPLQRLSDAFVVFMVCLLLTDSLPVLNALGITLFLMSVPHFYRFRLSISVLDDLPRLLLVGTIAPFIVYPLLHPGAEVTDNAIFSLAIVGGLLLSKITVSVFLRIRRSQKPELLSRTLILGSGELARELTQNLVNSPKFGLHPVAVLHNEEEPGPGIPGVALQPLDSNLPDLIRRYRANTVIIAFGCYDDEKLLRVLRSCIREDAELYLIPRLPEYHNRDESTEMIGAIPLRHVSRAAFRSLTWFCKRPFDILVSGIALIALSPLLGMLSLLVKRDTPDAPVLFRQTRIGLDGAPFELLKFRTLTPADPNESDSQWNIAGDKRLRPLGAMMRKFSLDELPQIYNVFRGDMALVGPRPERPYFVDKFALEIPGYDARHRVPVGLTGWAAINGLRGDTSIKERVLYDNYYIENWSPWLDAKILMLTFIAVFKGSGG
ncbi:UDP-glucose:undecaprenyl-phosphate glucose-1-phosphate transferase [Corynebacterium occultum]|uniref:UDP-glucose:undecaprenyl-phosphate glucose-1-phosphate transferase n=1 Tax=Corynebacterium occultum TaxID=2675219 RepID=A0A6B8WEV6_9CORY|nr:sugar transferase [Corynebacterium occultum]QGU08520.1 UDP-glucose:undecaprenyl-phosphate glucose-1-phosphate transferase [Corynebacterium occultum]